MEKSTKKSRRGIRAAVSGSLVAAGSIAVEAEVTCETQECVVNDAPKLHPTFEVGDVAHQGDVIIVCISRLPRSAKLRTNRQLAEGDTQGSRHVLERGEIYDADRSETSGLIREATRCDVQPEYVGPVFVSPAAPTANDLTHPEHGNQGFPAGAVCAVVIQRNLDAEEQEARVAD